MTSQLLVSAIPKVSTSRCEGNSSDTWPTEFIGDAVCAGYEGMLNAPQPCEGDSGGPLYDSNFVYALVSRGDASYGCGGSLRPTIFAPVWRASDFLLNTGALQSRALLLPSTAPPILSPPPPRSRPPQSPQSPQSPPAAARSFPPQSCSARPIFKAAVLLVTLYGTYLVL